MYILYINQPMWRYAVRYQMLLRFRSSYHNLFTYVPFENQASVERLAVCLSDQSTQQPRALDKQ